MAPRNPNKSQKNKTVDDSRSWQDVAVQTVFGKPGYQESGAGGLILKGLTALAKSKAARPIANTAQSVGRYVAEATGDAASFVVRQGRTVKTKGDVFTPEGVFKGKDVFIKKAPLTSKQIVGVQKGMDTRAANEFLRQSRIGAKGAVYGGVAGAAGLYGAQKGVETVKQNIKNAKKVTGAKVPKKR
jgi:hypothetical protein